MKKSKGTGQLNAMCDSEMHPVALRPWNQWWTLSGAWGLDGGNLSWLIFWLLFSFSGPHLWHMGAPRLGVESELQLSAYTIAIPDQSHICDLHCSLQQRQILNPLSEAWAWTHILMVPSHVLNLLSHNGDSIRSLYVYNLYKWGPKSLSNLPKIKLSWLQAPALNLFNRNL